MQLHGGKVFIHYDIFNSSNCAWHVYDTICRVNDKIKFHDHMRGYKGPTLLGCIVRNKDLGMQVQCQDEPFWVDAKGKISNTDLVLI